jgi:hypothetical protein
MFRRLPAASAAAADILLKMNGFIPLWHSRAAANVFFS